MRTHLLIWAVLAAFFLFLTSIFASVPPDRYCLAVICLAISGCNMSQACTELDGIRYCGPFQVPRIYWLQSGVKQNANFSHLDFEECVRDRHCSGATVTNYLVKYGEDCDRSGDLTCVDYGLVHRLGRRGCRRTTTVAQAINSTYYHRLTNISDEMYAWLTNSDAQHNQI